MQAISINRSKLIITQVPDEVTKKRITESSLGNLIRTNKYNGYISRSTTKRIKSMIEGFTSSVNEIQTKHRKVAIKEKIQNTFATLTLPYEQFHTDNEIKRKCLTPFLEELKKFHNIKLYIWRAEPQQNGNIHFHILLDRFVHHTDIRERWNRIINKLEYVNAFAQKHNHTNPNSTDIHSLQKVNSISSYIVKYMTKNKPSRKIEGRVWGCSTAFHNFKNPRVELTKELFADFNILRNTRKIFTRVYDYCEIAFVKFNDIIKNKTSKIAMIYKEFINQTLTPLILNYGT